MDRPVALLKMDIEGAEVAVLERLLERGLHDRVESAFVEVPDRKLPELVAPPTRHPQTLPPLQVAHIALTWHCLCEAPSAFCSCPRACPVPSVAPPSSGE